MSACFHFLWGRMGAQPVAHQGASSLLRLVALPLATHVAVTDSLFQGKPAKAATSPPKKKTWHCIINHSTDPSPLTTTMASSARALQSAKNLYQLLKGDHLSASSCREVLVEMEKNLDAAPLFKVDTFLKTLEVAAKSFRVEKRNSSETVEWDELLKTCDKLTGLFKKRQDERESEEAGLDDDGLDDDDEGVPKSTSVYLSRLKRQRKELYKNPPVLPPSSVVIQEIRAPLPQRDADGFLTFEPGTGKYDKAPVKSFKPNRTPEEILRGGAFGGTYFRSIVSAVTNKKYTAKEALQEPVPDEWIEGLDKKTMLTSQTYLVHVNKFKAKCGGCKSMVRGTGDSTIHKIFLTLVSVCLGSFGHVGKLRLDFRCRPIRLVSMVLSFLSRTSYLG